MLKLDFKNSIFLLCKSFFVSLTLFSFIYLDYFHISIPFLDTILALIGIYYLFIFSKKELFFIGFFTSIFWFWWVGYSFVFYDVAYLIPLAIVGIGVIYGLIFLLIGLFDCLIYRLFAIVFLSFIEPFGFNWFKLQLIFINSYFEASYLQFGIVVSIVALFVYLMQQNKLNITANITFVFVLCIIAYTNQNLKTNIPKPPLKIYSYNTHIPQELKWNKLYQQTIINDNFIAINKAIKQGYDMIILPETAFSVILDQETKLLSKLKQLSRQIVIITGALSLKDNMIYNSTYLIDNTKVQIANKVVLVPFGEAVPLPKLLRDFINNQFYNGAKDYQTAKKPTTFVIKNIKFRNAICYEITTNKIYQDLDTSYIIAISNNAWFVPSIEPTLQKLLIKYYSKKYHTIYFEAMNL